MTLDDVLGDLRAYLEHAKEEGERDITVSAEGLAAFEAVPAATAPGGRVQAETVARHPVSVDDSLASVAGEVAGCTKCVLHESRTQTVPGEGSRTPEILFVGEGPGADEDKTGRPFVGRAGQLLTKMIQAMGYAREDVFIANVVKCRPPGNRTPQLDEMETCLPYLKRQIVLLRPKVIVALGATAVKGLLDDDKIAITRVRGEWRDFENIPLMPTYHPAYLLRNPAAKRDVWTDLKTVLARLGRTPPPVNPA